jgi:hypothetical protein
MGSDSASATTRIGTFFNVLERIVLFALSLSVGLINLMIGLVMAARLGVIPKTAARPVLRATSQATAFVSRIMAPASAHATAPKRNAKR